MLRRVGMLGTGWMGNAIADDFAAHPALELAAVAGRDRDRAKAFAAGHGIRRALAPESLIADPDIDLVYVATTHESHVDLAIAALDAGKPVLVEKPLAVHTDGARRILDTARARGLFAMEAMWMRMNPVVRHAIDLIAAGTIGQPRTVQASFGFPLPTGDHRLWDPARAGGSLLDQGVYPLTLADLVFGAPRTVAASGSRLGYDGADTGVDTEVGVLLGYPGGQQAVLASSIRTVLPLDASIGGSEGRIRIDPAFWSTGGLSVLRPDGSEAQRFEVPPVGGGYRPMLDAVAEALDAGWVEHPLCDHATSVRMAQTVDRVRAALG